MAGPPVYVLDPRQMTKDEIVKAVRRIRYSSKRTRNQRQAPSINALAAAAGITRETAYQVAKTGRMSDQTANGLRTALDLSGKGEI